MPEYARIIPGYVQLFLNVPSCTDQKAGVNFEITNEEMGLILSILFLTGYHKLPDHKMYWEATSDAFV